MTNGQKLRGSITSILSTKKLSLAQKATLADGASGMYEPESLVHAQMEVVKLAKDNNITELIRLLKKLPTISKEEKRHFYINNIEVGISEFLLSQEANYSSPQTINGMPMMTGEEIKRKMKGSSTVKYSSMNFQDYCENHIFGRNMGWSSAEFKAQYIAAGGKDTNFMMPRDIKKDNGIMGGAL